MADGYKTIKYKHFPKLKKMNYTTPKTEIMSKRVSDAPRTGLSKQTIERYREVADKLHGSDKPYGSDKPLKQKPAKKKKPAKPLYDKVYK
jgi:hypothetical protein